MTRAGFVTFHTARTDDAEVVVAALRRHAHTTLRAAPGFVSARIHVSTDGGTVVQRTEWQDRESTVDAWPDVPGPTASVFEGTPAPGLEGPAAGREPGVVVVATRYLAGPESAAAVLELLAGSGRWKRDFPGFISATPYLSADGRTFVNYPTWVDESSFRAWTEDPNINGAREEVTRHELRPPDILVCHVVETIAREGVHA
ncbi:antibiotic biosynthesis monooxygenase [Actinophytocola sp.]|uniref:antibiotic biosynthesis monooxygenase n=1 Tax=Actinophytocola sp. TaxID=1872138 RepID=UPI003899E471